MCSHFRSKCRALTTTIFFLLPLISSLLFSSSTACSNGNCQQVLEACSAATDCGSGLFCGNCPALGLNQPICTRGQPILPTSTVNGLPFNKYSWIVTHNAFSIVDSPPLPGVQRLTFYNQEDSVTNQLRNGVRGLMLDMYDFQNDIWLCHSFRGQCFNFTAFQPAINTLKEVEAFLTQNPTELVTIIIEDYVHTPKGLTNLFTSAGLDKYWFPVSKMPKKGDDWPTVTEMVQMNHRLIVFTSDASKEAQEGIAYQWKHLVENESGDPGVQKGSCPHRKESKALNSKAAGNVVPNFIAVNFYMRSDGGGVFDIVDKMNGHSLCGCSTVAACQAGATYGSCKNISVPGTSPASITGGSGGFTGSVQFSKSASPVRYPNSLLVFLFYFLLIVVLFKL
ncbi:unnamed protein product [Vicia faba]|uniref:PI-PLC X domain-containing protein n=1 Tax=Vicia faba TaxID=3906 RepID=A0AAV1AJK4_VICFA|nr:unnamed protein product [Vicia faba]